MKILKLAKNKIYLENEIIDISKDIIYMYSLTVDMDITDIYYELIFESMKYKALYILGLKSRTEFELKNKLKEKYDKKNFYIIDDVVKKLKDMQLIDDYEYANSYIKYNMDKGENKVIDGNNLLGSTTLLYAFNSRSYLYMGVDRLQENLATRSFSSNRVTTRIGWGQEWWGGISSRIQLSYGKKNLKVCILYFKQLEKIKKKIFL